MADDIVRVPDKMSGPALLNREPVILPEQRKKAARKMRRRLNL